LLGGQHASVDRDLDESLIDGQLRECPIAQKIDAAIANVRDTQPAFNHERQRHSRPHLAIIRGIPGEFNHPASRRLNRIPYHGLNVWQVEANESTDRRD
jgi:hypothetical protein